MLAALTLLLVFQLIGEIIVLLLDLPVPGPVLGLALLFLWLSLRGGPKPELQSTASGLLQHLSLLFVPAGTGIMLHLTHMADEWLPLTLALVASTVIGLLVSAGVMTLLARRAPTEEQP